MRISRALLLLVMGVSGCGAEPDHSDLLRIVENHKQALTELRDIYLRMGEAAESMNRVRDLCNGTVKTIRLREILPSSDPAILFLIYTDGTVAGGVGISIVWTRIRDESALKEKLGGSRVSLRALQEEWWMLTET
jgi:hypothetical protein